MMGRGEEGSGSSKSANEGFGGIGRDNLNSVEETPGILRQAQRVYRSSIIKGARVWVRVLMVGQADGPNFRNGCVATDQNRPKHLIAVREQIKSASHSPCLGCDTFFVKRPR